MGKATAFFVLAVGILGYLIFVKDASLFGLNSHMKDSAGTSNLYADLYSEETGSAEERQSNYDKVVNSYYDIATDFYEYGWGTSFHFANRDIGESLTQSIARHEHFLALKLKLGTESDVIDVGCGVGGPAREIHRFSGAKVTGITLNDYQVLRARRHTQVKDHAKVKFHQADFMKIPYKNQTFSSAYAIESTCHAPNRVGVFSEIGRVLKPGSLFGAYEWCLTDTFDGKNATHLKMKKLIEEGNGLPDLIYCRDVLQAVKDAGFKVIEAEDIAKTPRFEVPWYTPLQATYLSLDGFRMNVIGRVFTHSMVTVLEFFGLAPKGTVVAHEFLINAAVGLVGGGELDIFTPMYFILAEKE